VRKRNPSDGDRARAALVSTRTALVNAHEGDEIVRRTVEKVRHRTINRASAKGLSQELRDALDPLLGGIASLNERIAEYDRRIEQIAKEFTPKLPY